MLNRCASGLTLLVLLSLLPPAVVQAERTIGWVDNARLYPGAISVHARADSGARISSLRYETRRLYRRGGKQWVEFMFTDRKGRRHNLHRPVVRMIKVRNHLDGFDRRPVVRLGICVADQYQDVEVSLAPRAEFNYPLLIGRNFLAGRLLVDPGATFLTTPSCRRPPGR